MTTPILVRADRLIEALLAHHTALAYQAQGEPGACLIDLGEGRSCPADTILASIRAAPSVFESQDLHIEVPGAPEVGAAFNALPEVQSGFSAMRQFAFRVGMTEEEVDPRRFDTARALQLYEGLPEEAQPDAYRLVARTLGFARVSFRVAELFLNVYHPGWRAVIAGWSFTISSHTSGMYELLDLRRSASTQIAAVLWFMDMVHLSDTAAAALSGQQVLPPGEWPRGMPGDEDDKRFELVGDEIAEGDEGLDPARDDFYRNTLKCRCLKTGDRFFGSRRYVAYIYAGSRVVVILDSPVIGNAAYLFLVPGVGGAEADGWIKDAVRTKGDLAEADEGQRGSFLRRFIHAAGWQDRLQRYLEGR